MSRRRGVVNNSSGLNNYNIQLKRRQTSFQCPYCRASTILLSKDFQKHCADQHHLNPKVCCVWCNGRQSWESGQKHSQADHLIQCWRDFMARHAPPAPSVPAPPPPSSFRPDPIPFDLTPMCAKEDFFGHEEVVIDRLYDPIWPMPLNLNAFPYADEGLNLAAACVRLYIQHRSTMEFFHVMVRLVAFPSFLRAMDTDQGRSHTLPFSTLCDGGHWREARHRQHRHMIVVSPQGHFDKHVWSKIKISSEDRPRRQYKCLNKRLLETPLHFMNTLGYLSQRESKCNFSKDECAADAVQLPAGSPFLNHFWIFTELPRHFRLPLVTQYDNGILDLLHHLYNNFSIDQLLRFPLVYLHQKWRLKIKDLPQLPLGLVLPVSQDLRPCSYPTPTSLCLLHGHKMYFERDAHPDTWLEEQVEHGNLFYHAVGEEYFTFRPYHQLLLHQSKPMALRNEELVAENTRLQQQAVTDQRQVRSLKRQVIHLKRQVQHLKTKADRWKRTAHRWMRTAENGRREKEELQKKINRMYEEDNVRLRAENVQLKRELERRRNPSEIG